VLLGIIDIVLNHTAGNSDWLLDHPEAAYNTDDCPHLTAAYVLDRAVNDFSCDFANRRNVDDCPSAPYINNEGDLRAVLNAIGSRVIPRLNINEYFMYNINDNLRAVRDTISSELRGKQLILDFFRKKFDRLKLNGKDQY
jgi:glycogen debranching enzyme